MKTATTLTTLDQTELYLELVFGSGAGHAHLAVGSEQHVSSEGKFRHRYWTETTFSWPDERARMIRAVAQEAAAGSDVYVCPYLTVGTKRAKGSSAARPVVHADCDGDLDPGRVRELGGFAVASGTAGHGHVYVPLSESVPIDWHRALCIGLRDFLGNADAKISDNDLLRPPGTLNYKAPTLGTGEAPTAVEWLVGPTGGTVTAQELADALGVTLPGVAPQDGGPAPQGVDVGTLDRPVADALALVSGDRSVDTMRVVGACYDAGLTLPQTRQAVATRDDLAERLRGRSDDDVLTCWLKAIDARAERRRGEEDPAPASPTGAADDDLREGMHHGQLRMAYRLANSHYRDRLMHVHGVGWHRWDTRRWAYDDKGHAAKAVRQVLRKALDESLDLDAEAAKAIRRDADKCSSAAGLAGVLSLAATMEPFAATVHDLDTDPYLLNVANGTLDLRTLELREHNPGDRITKVATAAYSDVDSGAWDTFLARVLPDAEVRGFLQRLAGLALLGRVVEHVLAILTGTGANGKGVFTRALEHALGDYASTAESDLFMAREGAHPTGEMDLLGRRWVTVSETDQGRRLAEATMKRLTGGDTIKARKMRQDFVEFRPSHTAVLVTNHLPAVRGDDPAIWRRIRVVPFDVVIPEDERDKHLDETMQLQAEAILSWAVAGYRDYAARGDLGQPEAVKVATSAYQLDSDPVARFVSDECVITAHGHEQVADLYTRWVRWASEDGAPELTPKAFGLALERKGYKAFRQSGRRLRRGLILTNEASRDA